MKTKTIKLAQIVFDYTLYPRPYLDDGHLKYMRQAYKTGAIFPPIVVDKNTMRCVDGFHRGKTYLLENGPDCNVEVEMKEYANEGEIFLDAMRYNSSHGRTLTRYDRTCCILKAKDFKLEVDQVAEALQISTDEVDRLSTNRIAQNTKSTSIPLKRTIQHMRGRVLKTKQIEANTKLGGMNQIFYVNQLLILLNNDLIDKENEKLMERLTTLKDMLNKYLQ